MSGGACSELSEVAEWAAVLARRRQELGLTQRALAEAAGLTQQAVSHIERGESIPRVTSMVRLARALGTTVEALLLRSGHEAEEKSAGRS